MKPLFTIHEGEFLVGDRINRRLGRKFDVWVPTKDTGVDLLVTRRKGGAPVGLQVKFSRGFSIPEQIARHVLATSWFALDPAKVRRSRADLWVFTILTLRHEEHFVLIPTAKLRARIPRGLRGKWNLYLWVYDDGSCYEVRTLRTEERMNTLHAGVRDRRLDFSDYLESWELLEQSASRRS